MAMQNSLGNVVLNWVQPKWTKATYELRNGEITVGSLQNLSSWNGKAIAQDDRNYFAFERKGFWKPQVIVRSQEGATLGTFTGGISRGGTLELANGRRFQWKHISFWSTKWAWLDEQGLMLAQFNSGG